MYFKFHEPFEVPECIINYISLHSFRYALQHLELQGNLVEYLCELWVLAGCLHLEEVVFQHGGYTNPVCEASTYHSTLRSVVPCLRSLDGNNKFKPMDQTSSATPSSTLEMVSVPPLPIWALQHSYPPNHPPVFYNPNHANNNNTVTTSPTPYEIPSTPSPQNPREQIRVEQHLYQDNYGVTPLYPNPYPVAKKRSHHPHQVPEPHKPRWKSPSKERPQRGPQKPQCGEVMSGPSSQTQWIHPHSKDAQFANCQGGPVLQTHYPQQVGKGTYNGPHYGADMMIDGEVAGARKKKQGENDNHEARLGRLEVRVLDLVGQLAKASGLQLSARGQISSPRRKLAEDDVAGDSSAPDDRSSESSVVVAAAPSAALPAHRNRYVRFVGRKTSKNSTTPVGTPKP